MAAYVGTTSATNGAGATSIAVTRTVAAGSVLVVWFTLDYSGTAPVYSCSDNNSGVWTSFGTPIQDTTSTQAFGGYYSENHASGSTTITVSFTSSHSFSGISVIEISGAKTSGAITASASKMLFQSAPTGSNSITPGAITPSAQPGILVGMAGSAQGTTSPPTAGTGMTSQVTGVWSGVWPGEGVIETLAVTSLAAVSATWTPGTNSRRHLSGAVFVLDAAATSGGGPSLPGPRPIVYGGRILRFDQLPQVMARRNIASPTVNAAVAQTLADVTSASTATVAVAAALAKTLDPLTSAATATVDVKAAVAATLGALTSASTATVDLAATVSQTLGALTSTATATVAVTVAVSATLDPLTSVATASGATSAAVAATLDPLTSVATATVVITAVVGATLGDLTCVSTATGGDTAAVGVTLDPLTSSATATVAVAAQVAQTLDALTSAATAAVALKAAVNATLDALTCEATAADTSTPAPTPQPPSTGGGGGGGHYAPERGRRKGPSGRATVAFAPSLYTDRAVVARARAELGRSRSSVLTARATATARPTGVRLQAARAGSLAATPTASAQAVARLARETVAELIAKASIAHLIDVITDDELTAILAATYQPRLTQAPAPRVPSVPSVPSAPSIGTPNEHDGADFYALTHAARETATKRVGRVGTLTVKAIADAVTVLAPLRDELAAAVANASSHAEAEAAIARVCAQYATDPDISEALLAPAVKADLAGRLMVRDHETAPGATRPVLMAGADGAAGGDGGYAAGDARALLDKPWTEAIDWFKARKLASPDELSTLLRDRAAQSEEAQRLLLETVQSRVKAMLADSLQNGGTFREFATGLRSEADGLGISADDDAYLQTVFRTNVATAYGAGRNAALNDPDVVEAFPFRQIRTAGDARVRDGEHGSEDHVQLNGLVFRSNDPVLRDLRSPFGFGCRCGIVGMREWSGDVITELPPNALHPGFGGI